MSIDDLIAERARTHGDFTAVARVAQVIRSACREAPGWEEMPLVQCEAVDAIAGKLARIVCGDSSFPDHWQDISGYARLLVMSLRLCGERREDAGAARAARADGGS